MSRMKRREPRPSQTSPAKSANSIWLRNDAICLCMEGDVNQLQDRMLTAPAYTAHYLLVEPAKPRAGDDGVDGGE